MLDVYYISLEYDKLDFWISELEKKASYDRVSLSKKFKLKKDRLRCLLSECLSSYALNRTFNIEVRKPFNKGKFGKPYIKQDVYFNVSHSGKYVICAVDVDSVGIDIEKVKPIDYRQLMSCFSEEERQQLNLCEDRGQLEIFYTLWVLKESYIKYTGEGFYFSVSECSFQIVGNNINYKNSRIENEDIVFDLLLIDKKYRCALCHQAHKKLNQIYEVCFSEII